MNRFEVIKFPSDRDLARAVAGAWLKEIEAANRAQQQHLVALSGGRIARHFFTATVEVARAREVSFASVHFFWADERCVPPDDPESNFRLANELLFSPLGVRPDQIHRIRGEGEPALAAAEAEAEIRRIAPLDPAGQPVLDVVFLGMGEDGHVASLFPGEDRAAACSSSVYRPVLAPKPPPRRITIGFPALAAARQAWVLISGPGKQAAMGESLSPFGQTPLAQLLRQRDQTRIYTAVEPS